MGDQGDDTPPNDVSGGKELEATINGLVKESADTLDDNEFLLWKAGRREWLIIIDLVAVALVVVC